MKNFISPQFFVSRTPLLSSETFVDLDKEKVIALMSNPLVREAIGFSSEAFLEEWDKQEIKTPTLIRTAFKYISRMSGRCVPFGMFAVLGLGKFSDNTEICRPDHEKLVLVHQRAGEEVDKSYSENSSNLELITNSYLFINPTLVFLSKNQVSFYSWDDHNEVRHYKMSHLELPKAVVLFLKNFSRKFSLKEGINFYKKMGASKSESQEMILNMMKERVLLPSFHPSSLESFPTGAEGKGKKTTFSYHGGTSKISEMDLSQIMLGVDFLYGCFKYRCHLLMREQFDFLIENFKSRFDTSFVPLKSFIGQYPHYPKPNIKKFEGELERFWTNTFIKRAPIKDSLQWQITLDENDFEELKKIDTIYARDSYSAPHSFSVMCSIGKDSIRLKSIYGAPGLLLLGRFTHGWDNLIEETIRFAETEQQESKEKIFAEIDHYLGAKGTNVSSRVPCYKFRIPLVSGGKSIEELDIDDLYIGLREDQFVLYSEKYDKEVMPHLNIAHNYKNNEMLYYSFLSSLCRQESFGLLFCDLGELNTLEHTPRISFKSIVLLPETWHFDSKVLEKAIINHNEKELSLPRFIQLVNGDKNLPFDLESPLAREVLLKEIKKNDIIKLEEVLPSREGFFNEIVIPFVHKKSREHLSTVRLYGEEQRIVTSVDNSLYFKFYFTAKLDVLVIDNLRKVINKYDFKNWFYIHYGDKDYHIRLRFFSLTPSLREETLFLIRKVAKEWLRNGLIWDFKIETYRPELDSYGGPSGIEIFHKLSHLDSVRSIDFILKRHSPSLHETYIFLIKESIDYLKGLFPDEEERITFISEYSSEVPDWERGMIDSIIEEEAQAFLEIKSNIAEYSLGTQPLNKKRQRLIHEFLDSCNAGYIHISPERLYSRMVHLMANRTSLKLFPFHEKRIQILVKNIVSRELFSQKRKL